ncbi:unnamed protein product [Lactuca saligna]|uniref:Uncharacterized protein n=1 Tax=Lactuca saligna TaxID=75948 RepID=A0AA35ZDP5_LACSI|nr:unnamed protein product [Lactuca saligna]
MPTPFVETTHLEASSTLFPNPTPLGWSASISNHHSPDLSFTVNMMPIGHDMLTLVDPHMVIQSLTGKVALVTGGDSGIGRSVCYFFAKEGATVAFTYVKGVEDIDAKYTLEIINDSKMSYAGDPIAIPADLRYDKQCKKVVDEVVSKYGRIDVLVNNAAVQYATYTLDNITEERLERIFRTNIFSYFFMTRHAIKHMKPGSNIINTTSVLGFTGNAKLIDYASTKGAIMNFTKSLAIFLIDKKIRVNGVAPGPIWTPLTATLDDEDIATFGSQAPMNRAAQPVEVGSSYVFLASEDASYYTGTFLHPDGGELDKNAIPRVNNNKNSENP